MIDRGIPLSLVRLEQRAGPLHRIGQEHDGDVHHLVASQTREGRVQELMLENLSAAGRALGGRIVDLVDAAIFRADFGMSPYRAIQAATRDAALIIGPHAR